MKNSKAVQLDVQLNTKDFEKKVMVAEGLLKGLEGTAGCVGERLFGILCLSRLSTGS